VLIWGEKEEVDEEKNDVFKALKLKAMGFKVIDLYDNI
jgi:hypothetical protein